MGEARRKLQAQDGGTGEGTDAPRVHRIVIDYDTVTGVVTVNREPGNMSRLEQLGILAAAREVMTVDVTVQSLMARAAAQAQGADRNGIAVVHQLPTNLRGPKA